MIRAHAPGEPFRVVRYSLSTNEGRRNRSARLLLDDPDRVIPAGGRDGMAVATMLRLGLLTPYRTYGFTCAGLDVRDAVAAGSRAVNVAVATGSLLVPRRGLFVGVAGVAVMLETPTTAWCRAFRAGDRAARDAAEAASDVSYLAALDELAVRAAEVVVPDSWMVTASVYKADEAWNRARAVARAEVVAAACGIVDLVDDPRITLSAARRRLER